MISFLGNWDNVLNKMQQQQKIYSVDRPKLSQLNKMLTFLLSGQGSQILTFFLNHVWKYSINIVNLYLISSFFVYLLKFEQVWFSSLSYNFSPENYDWVFKLVLNKANYLNKPYIETEKRESSSTNHTLMYLFLQTRTMT